jgi:amidase
LVLSIVQGTDWRDASVVPVPLAEWRLVRLGSLRVAWYTACPDGEPAPAVARAVEAAAAVLASSGLTVQEAQPPAVEQTYEITREYWNRPEPESWEEWDAGEQTVLSSLAVEQHLFRWDRFRRALLAWMEPFDAVLTPAAQLPARPHDEEPGHIAYTLTYSLVGYPAAVVRCGTSEEGMPVGVQIVAQPWRDDVALALAAWLEKELGGWQQAGLAI